MNAVNVVSSIMNREFVGSAGGADISISDSAVQQPSNPPSDTSAAESGGVHAASYEGTTGSQVGGSTGCSGMSVAAGLAQLASLQRWHLPSTAA